MNFTSVPFFFFLAFSVFTYSLAGAKLRPLVLLLASLAWYASWRPEFVALFMGIGYLNYIWLRLAARGKPGAAYVSLAVLDGALLLLFKSGRIFGSWQAPVGASFSMLFLIGIVMDLARKRGTRDPGGPLDFLVLSCFFPVHLGGPIERRAHLAPQLARLEPLRTENVIDGMAIFALGLLKNVLVAVPLEQELILRPAYKGTGWLLLVCLSAISIFWAYVSFSSICDMGRGAARMFGIEITPNFRPFYYSKNPNEFWQRWNVTLGTWIRDYVSFPAMLRFGRSVNQYLIVFLTFLLVGIWHGLTFNWLLFGIFNGVVIALSLALQNGPLLRKPDAARAVSWALLVFLLLGMGLLSRPEIFETFGPAAGLGGIKSIHWSSIFLPLVALGILDYLQETRGKADFFLDAPFLAKCAGVAVFCAWLLVGMHEGRFYASRISDPPLYFRF